VQPAGAGDDADVQVPVVASSAHLPVHTVRPLRKPRIWCADDEVGRMSGPAPGAARGVQRPMRLAGALVLAAVAIGIAWGRVWVNMVSQ